MQKIVDAVKKAALYRPDLMTGDAINALAGGHGMLNLAVFCVANAIAEATLEGRKLKVVASNQEAADMDEVVERAVKAALDVGADPSNAALIAASLCYIAGSNVRAGVPSGNRKLGAMARMKAGAQRGGVALLPTPKGGNKISAFPAVQKIYEAMLEGGLTRVNGAEVPPGILGTPLAGHSALGEDYIFPEVAENAATIGAQAMMKAYTGAGMKPNPFISAVFAAAATLEIVHPDAAMPDRYGPSMRVFSPTVVGMAAAKATGLPETVHFRVTGEEFRTADLVGDLGLILRDIGTPTVVGMLAFYEIFGCFAESSKIGTGGSGGPRTSPIGHVMADASIALRIIALTGSVEEAADVVAKNKLDFLDPEIASIEANTVARKVDEIRPGPVSNAVLAATMEITGKAVEERARITYQAMADGLTLTQAITSLEERRMNRIEARASAMISEMAGKRIIIKFDKLAGGARRSGKVARQFYVLDPDIDVAVTVDGEEIVMQGLLHRVLPTAVLEKDQRTLEIISMLGPAVGELLVSGHTLVDLIVPVATAAVMGKGLPAELAAEAVARGSLATGGMPGTATKATEVAELAVEFYSGSVSN